MVFPGKNPSEDREMRHGIRETVHMAPGRVFCSPSVSRTLTSSSPSSRFSARMPLLRRFLSVSTGRRFTVPLRVTMVRNRFSAFKSRKWIIACTRSPVSTWMMLTMFVPLAALPLSGI